VTTTAIELKRHYRKLSEKQTDELAGAVADLIVEFIKSRGCGRAPEPSSVSEPAGNARREIQHGPSRKQ